MAAVCVCSAAGVGRHGNSGFEGLQQGPDTQNADHPLQVVGHHVQAHLGFYQQFRVRIIAEAFPADRIGLVTSIGVRGCCA